MLPAPIIVEAPWMQAIICTSVWGYISVLFWHRNTEEPCSWQIVPMAEQKLQ